MLNEALSICTQHLRFSLGGVDPLVLNELGDHIAEEVPALLIVAP